MNIYEEIKELANRREKIKAELFEAISIRRSNQERWLVYGESTPLIERVALDAKIACLTSDRQTSKIKLKTMRQGVVQLKDNLYREVVKEVLIESGLGSAHATIGVRFAHKLEEQFGEYNV